MSESEAKKEEEEMKEQTAENAENTVSFIFLFLHYFAL